MVEFALTRHTADSISIVSEAEISVQRGEIALTQLRYIEAVRYFGNAAESFRRRAYRNERIEYLRKEAGALFKQGVEFGDNNALLDCNRALFAAGDVCFPRSRAAAMGDDLE